MAGGRDQRLAATKGSPELNWPVNLLTVSRWSKKHCRAGCRLSWENVLKARNGKTIRFSTPTPRGASSLPTTGHVDEQR